MRLCAKTCQHLVLCGGSRGYIAIYCNAINNMNNYTHTHIYICMYYCGFDVTTPVHVIVVLHDANKKRHKCWSVGGKDLNSRSPKMVAGPS